MFLICCCFFTFCLINSLLLFYLKILETYRQLVVVTAVNAIDIIAVVDAIDIDGVAGQHAVVGPVIVVVIAVEAGGQMRHSHL